MQVAQRGLDLGALREETVDGLEQRVGPRGQQVPRADRPDQTQGHGAIEVLPKRDGIQVCHADDARLLRLTTDGPEEVAQYLDPCSVASLGPLRWQPPLSPRARARRARAAARFRTRICV